MLNQPGLKLPFVGVLGEGEEIEVVGVLQQLLCKIGLGRWQGPLKIGDRFALAMKELGLNVKHQHVPAPTVFDGSLGVPEPFFSIFYLVQNRAIVKPGQASPYSWCPASISIRSSYEWIGFG